MARPWRVRDRASFAALRRSGARRRTGALTVTRLDPADGGSPVPAVAYAIGRSVGGAVERNRVKRLLREAFSRRAEELADGQDVVLVARPDLKELADREGADGVARVLDELVEKAGLGSEAPAA